MPRFRLSSFFPALPGLALMAALAACCLLATRLEALRNSGISPLTLAIIGGALLGNIRPQLAQGNWQAGLRFAQKTLLRIGVALYGFNLSLQQVSDVGSSGLLIALLMVCSTLLLGYLAGTRWLHLDRHTALLIAAGSAICGAAAIVATVPMLRLHPLKSAGKTAAAIATVVLFGTLAMLLYPLLYPPVAAYLGVSRAGFGIYIGSTVHEVAQVVAISSSLGSSAAEHAITEKMLRVMLLVPFLLGLSWWSNRGQQADRPPTIDVPWFALCFILFAALNTWLTLPLSWLSLLQQTGTLCLTLAMAAFGMETTFALLRQAGIKPLLLGGLLFTYLVIGGGLINIGLGA